MSRIRKVLTFSNIVAVMALFVALGGSVYAAGKINGKQVKPKSLPGNRIKPKTIVANRIKPKSLTGAQVKPRSLTGKQIKQGTLTGVAAASLANVQYTVATALLPNSELGTTVTANCPAKMFVVGGGATVTDGQRALVNGDGPNSLRTGWTATGFGYSFGGQTKPTMTVTAICVAVKGPVGPGPATPPNYQPAG